VLRHAYLALCAHSLLLLITVLAFWLHFGRYRPGIAIYPSPHAQYAAFASADKIVLRRETFTWSVPRDVEVMWTNLWTQQSDDVGDEINSRRRVQLWQVGELATRRVERTYPSNSGGPPYRLRESTVFLPHWLLCVIFALLPLHGAVIVRRERRRRRGAANNLCSACGYDLRASPGQCPECGAAPAPPPAAVSSATTATITTPASIP
jgi:hypothetical protein